MGKSRNSKKEEKIVSYTLEEIKSGKAGKDKTDWDKLDNMTEEEIEANAFSDEEFIDIEDARPITKAELQRIRAAVNSGKESVTIRLDKRILQHFERDKKGYQTRINNFLLHKLGLESENKNTPKRH